MMFLDLGIKYFGLWQERGIKLFDTKEYNKLSYDFHKEVGEFQLS